MRQLVEDYRITRIVERPPLLAGLDRLSHQVQGWFRRRPAVCKSLIATAEEIRRNSLMHQSLSDEELTRQLQHMQQNFRRRRGGYESHLKAALALISEAAFRSLQMRPYTVQIMGALLLNRGCLAEMATGEGKSLTIGMQAVVAGWSGDPCHVITANDYLAGRDSANLAPLYHLCGLTTGAIAGDMSADERKRQYGNSIVYATGKELLADFLRDRLALGKKQEIAQLQIRKFLQSQISTNPSLVMRGIDTAIIDEVDNILIDEAVTPLIISQQQANQPLNEACSLAHKIVTRLKNSRDFRLDPEHKEVVLTEEGKNRIAELSSGFPPFFRGEKRRNEVVLTALVAREFFLKDHQYVVENGKVVIVDEFTGRKMDQRTWRHGLQQAIEIKEGVPLTNPSETLARLSFQKFFSLFRKLSGTTGTAWEAKREFWHVYQLPVVPVPTHRPCRRKQLATRNFLSEKDKLQAIVEEIVERHAQGQPVLVGTRSVAVSEKIGRLLTARTIPHQILNAVKHKEEADIITFAGQYKKVTVATNMAGRGADIRLGEGVDELGGLHVIVSERHESRRIDRQLIGRCARQGEPGTFRIYNSYEDELVQRHGPKFLLGPLRKSGRFSNALKLSEALFNVAQKIAQKKALEQRAGLLKRDDWLKDSLPYKSCSNKLGW